MTVVAKTPKKLGYDNLTRIAEILGIVEEKGKTKDWLLEEIKRKHIGLNVSPTANSFEILKSCPDSFVSYISKLLKDDFVIEDVRTPTKTLHWFYTDIVGSSDPTIPVKIQARKINLLNTLMKKTETFKQRESKRTYIQTTGDGMAIGFGDSSEKPLRLAIELHKLLYKYNKTQREKDRVYLRIGIDTGPIYFIKDVEENDTVWGPGIIMARRVMDLCSENQIFASRRIGDDIRKLSPEYKAIMHPIGDYSIKHGEQLLVYNIYGKNFGNKISPKKDKIRIPSIGNDLFAMQPKFEFNSVEIRLDVTNPENMMTHHTWIWNVKNTSKKPLEQIFYYIIGDTPRSFGDLNLSVKDENNNNLEIISLDVNKPQEKKFYVKLAKPLRKNQKGRLLKLEYDWEEPYRVFEYELSARCKKLRYAFTAPKNMELKNRILEVAKELGIKKRAEPPSKTNYKSDIIEMTWETDKKHIINKHDAFEFQW